MGPRRLVLYVFGLGAACWGFWLVVRDPEPLAAPDSGREGLLLATEDASSQVLLERGTAATTVPAPRADAQVRTPEQMEGDRREDELREVLERLGGEPVYVEGVDGPAPQRTTRQR